MRMSFGLTHRLLCLRTLCEQSVEEHDSQCPFQSIINIQNTASNIGCPQCNKPVEINHNDHYECRVCHTQFSRSPLDESRSVGKACMIDWHRDESFSVLVLADKGAGDFPIDKKMADAQARLQAALKEKGVETEE